MQLQCCSQQFKKAKSSVENLKNSAALFSSQKRRKFSRNCDQDMKFPANSLGNDPALVKNNGFLFIQSSSGIYNR